MSERPRLLFLSQCLPYPPDTGVTNRNFNLLRQLQKRFDVALVPFWRRNHQRTPEQVAAAFEALRGALHEVWKPEPIAAEHSGARRVRDHLASLATRRPFTFHEYASPRFARNVREAVQRHRPHLVHMDSNDLHAYLPLVRHTPVACTHHNVESHFLRRRAEQARVPLLGSYIRFQAQRLEELERSLSPALALNLMVSEVDAERLRALAPGSRVAVVPNGVDTDFFAPRPEAPVTPARLVFLGPTFMFANRDAVEHLLRDIWPRVRAGRPDASLALLGRSAPRDEEAYARHPGVVPLGYVPDTRPHLAACECFVVPIRVGGGTRLKILEAWAMGKAVVSTSVGCEGLGAVDGDNMLIRDDARGFAEAVLRVLSDPALRRRLERRGRETALERFSWNGIGGRLNDRYQEVVDEHAAPSAGALAR